jgi:hypothetical protein
MAPEVASTASHWFDGSIGSVLLFGAVFGFFRGVIRQVLWVGAVGAGAYVTYVCHQKFGEMGFPPGRLLLIASGAVGFVSYWIVRKISGWLVFLKGLEMTGASGMLAGLLPSGALVWLAGVGLRWFGAQDHLAELATTVKHPEHRVEEISLWSEAKHALDGGVLGRVVGWLDPVTPNSHVNLANLIVIANAKMARRFESDPAISKALQNPKLQTLRKNERIRLLVEHDDYAALLYDRDMNAALADADFKKEIEALHFPKDTR